MDADTTNEAAIRAAMAQPAPTVQEGTPVTMTDPVADIKAAVTAAKNYAVANSSQNLSAVASLKTQMSALQTQIDDIMGVESKNEALKLLADGVDLLVKGEQVVTATSTGTWMKWVYGTAALVLVLGLGAAGVIFHWI